VKHAVNTTQRIAHTLFIGDVTLRKSDADIGKAPRFLKRTNKRYHFVTSSP
jgi:hypothetical protein